MLICTYLDTLSSMFAPIHCNGTGLYLFTKVFINFFEKPPFEIVKVKRL